MKKIGLIISALILSIFVTKAATVTWDISPEGDVTGYKVYWGTNALPPFENVLVLVGRSPTSALIYNTNFLANTKYNFSLTAYNSVGLESGYSTVVSFTNLVAPSTVKNLRISLIAP
jgi:hypothetical protein